MTAYLDLEDALHIVARLGFHVRDPGLLESALARPATSVYGMPAYPSLELKAAALLESLVRNHALVDGNKRTAWTTMIAFLWINGYTHSFSTGAAFELILSVAEQRIELATAAALIGNALRPR